MYIYSNVIFNEKMYVWTILLFNKIYKNSILYIMILGGKLLVFLKYNFTNSYLMVIKFHIYHHFKFINFL